MEKLLKIETDLLLYDRGKTEYDIIIDENANKNERFAAEEFADLFELASNIKLDIVHKNNSTATKHIFIGAQSDTEFIKFLDTDLDEQFVVTVKGPNLYIKGKDGNGTVFGVYKYFEAEFGYEFFAEDEIKIEKPKTKAFLKLNISDAPMIAYRSLSTYYTRFNNAAEDMKEYRTNFRYKFGRDLYTNWILSCHTYFQILPKDKYYSNHKDWYSPDGINLCLSNQEMRDEFAKVVVKKIDARPDGKFLMIGQEDNFTFCDCQECKNNKEIYGSTSGFMMSFSNDIARRVKIARPKSKVKLITFAYNATAMAPVYKDPILNEYVPYCGDVIAEDNLAVMIVPLNGHYSLPLDSPDSIDNVTILENFRAWKTVTKDIFIWDYHANFGNYIVPLNEWDAIERNPKIYAKFGTKFFYTQSYGHKNNTSFIALRTYLNSMYRWGSDKPLKEAIQYFIKNYYKEASGEIFYLFKLLKANYEYVEQVYNISSHSWGDWVKPEIFPKSFLEYCLELEKRLDEKIDPNNKVVVKRYKHEFLLFKYLYLVLYEDKDYDKKVEELYEAFKADNVAQGREGKSLSLEDFKKR